MASPTGGVILVRVLFWLGVPAILFWSVIPENPARPERRETIEATCLGREVYNDSTYAEYYYDPVQRMIHRRIFVANELSYIDMTILSPPTRKGGVIPRGPSSSGFDLSLLSASDWRNLLDSKNRSYRITLRDM